MDQISTRERILEAADELFYAKGFDHTSFADIAGEVGLSRGNFYHHFKSKDDILAAVIDMRLGRTRDMLKAWEAECPDPVARIGCYIRILIANRAQIKLYGCPVGTLTTELAKLDHIHKPAANKVFSVFIAWLTAQFETAGQADRSKELALDVMSWSQGVATMAAAFQDDAYIDREVAQKIDWLNTIRISPTISSH